MSDWALPWCLLVLCCGLAGSPHALGAEPPSPPGDVRRHGAICDGSADDTQALIRAGQASLDVYIPVSLDCRVIGPLAAGIRPGQRWHGGGTVRTDDGFNFTVFSVIGKPGVRFENLQGRSGTPASAIQTADARFIEFTAGSHGGRVSGSRIEGFQQAIRVHGSRQVRIEGNDVVRPFGWGISIQTGAHAAAVVRNQVSGVAGEHAIYVAGSPGDPVEGTRIEGNLLSGSRLDGVKLSYSSGAEVVGNVVFRNGGQGIYLTLGASHADVQGNVVLSNGESGVMLYEPRTMSDSNRVHRNVVHGNGRHGIAVSSAPPGRVSRTAIFFNDIGAVATAFPGGVAIFRGIDALDVESRENHVRDEAGSESRPMEPAFPPARVRPAPGDLP